MATITQVMWHKLPYHKVGAMMFMSWLVLKTNGEKYIWKSFGSWHRKWSIMMLFAHVMRWLLLNEILLLSVLPFILCPRPVLLLHSQELAFFYFSLSISLCWNVAFSPFFFSDSSFSLILLPPAPPNHDVICPLNPVNGLCLFASPSPADNGHDLNCQSLSKTHLYSFILGSCCLGNKGIEWNPSLMT